MPAFTRATFVLLLVVSVSFSYGALPAPSPENNPFAATADQVNARFVRIQQEVDRLRAAGLNSAADLMAQSLQHFRDELAGRAQSLIGGSELDGVSVYTGNSGNPVVDIHPTDRPVVLALSGYESMTWSLRLFPGARLEKVIVAGYEAVSRPLNVPANVPVELDLGGYRDYSKSDGSYVAAVRSLYQLTGLQSSSYQGSYGYSGTAFSIGTANSEWSAERVLSEMQPLYKEATAFQLAQDRAGAEQYHFTALYSTYSSTGSRETTRVAQMTPLRAVDGTILSKFVNYKSVAIDPRGPTYYGMSSFGTLPVRFDPVTGKETQLPPLDQSLLHGITAMTFDTMRNRLVITNRSGDPSSNGFLLYYPDDATWLRTAVANQPDNASALAYVPALDAYFGLENPRGAMWLARYDSTGLYKARIDLSHFATCGFDPCQLITAGDRLVLLVPPAADLYDPLLPPLPHSFLIDPTTGNVTILGALPEPGGMVVLAAIGLLLSRRGRGERLLLN